MAIIEKIACTPTIGEYHILADILMERCLHYQTMLCPPMTKRTLELGARHSPDMICTPFKITLGNFIEAAEAGANVFVMPGTACRLGFYDMLQQQILTDLGYDCEVISLFDYIPTVNRLCKALQDKNPDLTSEAFAAVFDVVAKIAVDMDNLADFIRRNIAFEVTAGSYNSAYKAYLNEVKTAQSVPEAEKIGVKYQEILNAIPTNKPDRPMRIGIIGEIYAVAEPFANGGLEKWLIEHGVEIIRTSDLTHMAIALFSVDKQIEKSGGYVDYNIGSTANDAIAQAYEMVTEGIDGIIHIKPASCSPEITAMTILQNMARDYSTPFMYFTFDTETSEAGLHTRLEAFYDMIMMKGLKEK